MDKQFILNNTNKHFIDLKQQKNKIKGVELAFKFLNLFYADIKNLQCLSNSGFVEDLVIYDFNQNLQQIIKVDKKMFQHQFQFFYRQFIEDYYFMSFPWYQEFSENIQKLLIYEFNYNSIESMKFVIRMVSNSFVIYSNGKNNYDYIKVVNHLTKVFCYLGMPLEESKNFSIKILKNLEIYEFIFIKKNLVGSEISFCLNDPYIDIVFFLNSLFVAIIYEESETEFNIKYNPYIGLSKLTETISFFQENLEKNIKNSFPDELNQIDFFEKILDFSNLESKNNIMEFSSDEVRKFDLQLYFNNILLNEYCFHVIIMSCFQFYCTRFSLKNVLFSYKNYSYYLNP